MWPHDALGTRLAKGAVPLPVRMCVWAIVAVAALPIALSLIEAGPFGPRRTGSGWHS